MAEDDERALAVLDDVELDPVDLEHALGHPGHDTAAGGVDAAFR